MSIILHVTVGHLLGETEETDPNWAESMANWNESACNSRGLDASVVVRYVTSGVITSARKESLNPAQYQLDQSDRFEKLCQ
jgi:hypothetical protein